MPSQLLGIETWVSSIRHRMANDPGRQDLEDHIFCNGFLFLQEYLEDILNGTESEPIIELTKTPGRRKDMSRKDKLESATKAKRFLESPDKEHAGILSVKPIPSFKASLQDERLVKSEFPVIVKSQGFPTTTDEREEQAVEILVTPPSAYLKKPECEVSPSLVRTVKFSLGFEPIENAQHNGTLSMIAEDDEQETLQPLMSPRKGLIIGDREISYQIPKDPDNPDGPMATITVPYSEDDRSFDDSEPTSTIGSFPIDPYARDYETHELPKIMPEVSPQSIKEKLVIQVSAPNLVRKASVPVFPILPPPSPMRKSARDSVDASNAVTMKAINNGGRTSWLQKARDVTAKHGGVKRKSDEMLEDHARNMDGFLNKLPKISRVENSTVEEISSDTALPKPVIQPFRPIIRPRDPPPVQVQHVYMQGPSNEDTTEMMDILKRTVDGLGARVGRGLVKSLGGAAASAAAAEAKAAAEARLAQRETKGSDGAGQPQPSLSQLTDEYETGFTNECTSEGSHFNSHLAPTSPIAPRLLLDRVSIGDTHPDFLPNASIRMVSQNTIPQFQVQRPPLKDFVNSQSQSQGYSQPSTQSTYVSNLFDDNWTQSSFTTEFTTTQAFTQSQSQGLSQPFQDDVFNSQNIEHSKESKQQPHYHERFIIDVPREVEDEEEMVLGQDAISPAADSQSTKTKDDQSQSDDAASQRSEDKPQGFMAQATNMISKVMSSATLKRVKPEPVKSIQLAAAAAKKQQEEAEKKAARLKEMEKRRAVIASKKAEQDATDKLKLPKRDREDDTTKVISKKVQPDDDTTKKRRVVVEIEKKPVNMKKPPSKDKPAVSINSTGTTRTLSKTIPSTQTALPPAGFANATKQTRSTVNSGRSQLELKTPAQASSSKLHTSHSKQNLKETAYEDTRQPSETLQAQMHARVQAQMIQAKQQEYREPLVPSESIELPEINSEYSNSDDEDRPRTFDPPEWAQSPVLAHALHSQSRLNPDDIFGPVKPLRMDEIFKKNTSRFRARTSSANWMGTDELTKEEEKDYAKRMGYVKF